MTVAAQAGMVAAFARREGGASSPAAAAVDPAGVGGEEMVGKGADTPWRRLATGVAVGAGVTAAVFATIMSGLGVVVVVATALPPTAITATTVSTLTPLISAATVAAVGLLLLGAARWGLFDALYPRGDVGAAGGGGQGGGEGDWGPLLPPRPPPAPEVRS